jgi:hypothetical protein
MRISEFRMPTQSFYYEFTVVGGFCCEEMKKYWKRKEFIEFVSEKSIKFCPFCGEKIIIEKDD